MAKSKNKNLGATRVFRERGQLGNRSRLGLLEKHKDYVHRARDYRSKQDRLKKLREKAAFRNKDEFYHGMVKSKTKDGVAYGDRGNVALSSETVKMLKTQDVGYVRMQIAKDQRKIEKLRREIETLLPPNGSYDTDWTPLSELAEIEKLAEMGIVLSPRDSGKRKGKSVDQHILFAEDADDLQTIEAGPSRPRSIPSEPETQDLGWDETPAKVARAARRSTSVTASIDEEAEERQAQQNRLSLYAALSAHLVRLSSLRAVESKLASTIGLFGKGSAQKVRKAGWVEDETAQEDRNGEKRRFVGNVFKWKLERRK